MNPTELELFLYRHTESESWHLQHPGQLSHLYDKMKQEEFRGEVGYCFDFVNTLEKRHDRHDQGDPVYRYPEAPPCGYGTELHLQRVVHLCHQWQRNYSAKKAICAFWTVTFGTAPPAIKKEHDIVINIVFRRQIF